MKTNYNAALQLYDDMIRGLPKKRPTCEEILKQRNLWALNKNELQINDELREEIISKINENQIIFSILKSKLNI